MQNLKGQRGIGMKNVNWEFIWFALSLMIFWGAVLWFGLELMGL